MASIGLGSRCRLFIKFEEGLEPSVNIPPRFVASQYGYQEALDQLRMPHQGRVYLDKWVKPVLGDGGFCLGWPRCGIV